MSAPLKVVLHARFGRQPIIDVIGRTEGVEAIVAETVDDLLAALPQADILALTNPSRSDGARIASGLSNPESNVRWIQAMSAGFDGLLDHDLPPDLMITGQGGAMAPPVAEHAIGLLLGISRGMFEIAVRSRARSWDRDFTPPLMALEGRRAVIVGMGNIGQEIARRLRSFDMHVTAVGRTPPSDGSVDAFAPLADLHNALAGADVILLAIALAPETRGLFGEAAFAACKPGALLINVARGELVDQVALSQALHAGRLGGAAIDVTTPEPLPPADPLWAAPRLVISPHTAGAGSPLAARRIASLFADNLARYRGGEPLLASVR